MRHYNLGGPITVYRSEKIGSRGPLNYQMEQTIAEKIG
jgi:hypothetical protein